MKTLEIGKNYGECFGLDASKGCEMIYSGGDNWLARKPGAEKIITTPDTTKKAIEYINRPYIHLGK